MSLSAIFLVIALVLAFCAAFGVPSSRVNLFALAFAFFLMSLLIGSKVIGLS